jgi:hypothetical protein
VTLNGDACSYFVLAKLNFGRSFNQTTFQSDDLCNQTIFAIRRSLRSDDCNHKVSLTQRAFQSAWLELLPDWVYRGRAK